MSYKKYKIAFLGTPEFSKVFLEELKKFGIIPDLIITGEDKPVGRKLVITPPPVKIFAEENNIPFIQPKTLKNDEVVEQIKSFGGSSGFDIFILASYGKIIPKSVLDIPKKGTINLHPSLLPKLRGASPIQGAILNENETGISIMLLDEEMDHGPILAQEKIENEEVGGWPARVDLLEKVSAIKGAKLLATVLEDYLEERLIPKEQDHEMATYCKKIKKEDGLINFEDSPEVNFRKVKAFIGWPTTYFFVKDGFGNDKRVIITEAHLEGSDQKAFIIDKVIPEGKKEMDYKLWQANQK